MIKKLVYVAPLVLILACGNPGGGGGVVSVIDALSINYGGSGHSVTGYTHNGEAQTQLTVNLTNLVNSDVLLVFTNTGDSSEIFPSGSGSGVTASTDFSPTEKSMSSRSLKAPRTPAAIREFNAHPLALSALQPKGSLIGPPSEPLFYGLDDTKDWIVYDGSPGNGQGIETARLKSMVSGVGGKTLHTWIHDSWYGPGKIDDTKLQSIIDTFYHSSLASIYPMTTQIVGSEWGSHPYSGQLIPSTTPEIHIVIYDILNDGAWGIIGYFWSVNNYTNSYLDSQGSTLNSNEALVFFMDAPTYLDTGLDGDKFFLRTLAHEFQHMIHFYQKFVKRSTSSETWLNEMASMLVEDLLASHIVGLNYGPATWHGDRLHHFTIFPDDSLMDWNSSEDDYASTFAFGCFAIRHYGTDAGASFTRKIVQSSFGGMDAVDFALSQTGAGINADEALRRWGATMAIDPGKGPVPSQYGYLDSNWVVSNYFGPGIDLILEAASMYEFQNPPSGPPTMQVPKRYSTPPGVIPAGSNVVWEYQTDVTGNLSVEVVLPSYTSLSVVVSPHL